MSTSLKEQLRKLAVPQSSAIVRSKKRASILFTPEEAAEKSRETVFEIGTYGLEELIKRNSIFEEFRNNLFHETYKNFERSVHDTSMNEKLDKNIQKFFLYLSPYFVLKDACMALEWLIYRYSIQEYNRNDFLMMMLPYHETNMFIRALQVIPIKNENDNFGWLKKLQKSRLPLSKNMLYNHASSNPAFLKSISTYLLAAVKLHNEPERLNVFFNFYCLTFCGAIQHTQVIDDRHVTSIIPALLKGLKSDISDFLAGSIIITSTLISKTGLTEKLLNKFIESISNFNVTNLNESCVMLLVKIYQTQSDFKEISSNAVEKLANQKWICKVLEDINQKFLIDVFLKVLFKGILNNLVDNGENVDGKCGFLVEILNGVELKEDIVIYLIGLIYELNTKTTSKSIQSWMKKLILNVETKYPNIFDKEINKLLKIIPGEALSKEQKRFQNVLSSSDNNEILQQLYHPAASVRKESIKNLMANSSNLKEREQTFLKDALLDRLNDDNQDVVFEALKCSKKFISDLIDDEVLVNILVKVLYKCQENGDEWKSVAKLSLQILCGIGKEDDMNVFIAIFLYLLPVDDTEMILAKLIVESDYFCKSKTFCNAQKDLIGCQTSETFVSIVLGCIKSCQINISELIVALQKISSENNSTLHKYVTSLLLCSVSQDDYSPNIAYLILKIIMSFLSGVKLKYQSKFKSVASGIILARKNKFSLQGFLYFLETLCVKCVKVDLCLFDFGANSDSSNFFITIFGVLLQGCCTIMKQKISNIYAITLKNILNLFCCDLKSKLGTFLNISIADNPEIDNGLKLRCLRTINSMLESTEDVKIGDNFLIGVLICFGNEEKEIREAAFNVIETLLRFSLNGVHLSLIKGVKRYKDEILSDYNQIPVVINTITEGNGILNLLLNVMIKSDQLYVRIGLGKLLMLHSDLNVYNKISQVCLDMIKSVDDDYKFKSSESQFIKNVIEKLDQNVASKLTLEMNVLNLISLSLEKENIKLFLNTSDVVLPFITLSIIDRETFENFPKNLKSFILQKLIAIKTKSQNPDVVASANKTFKHIDLDSKLILEYFIKMRDVQSQKISAQKRKRRISIIPSVDILDMVEWRQGLTVLESIHDKKKIQNPSILLPVLFEILNKCLQFDEQSNVEYPKQLILSCILNSCKRAEDLPENVFSVEIIVQCIRASQNPQTHHEALSVLAHTAHLIPNQVLHHIMAIFTFMGSSVLRYDDAYSFQIINKIVDTILPILVKNDSTENIVKVLRVFVDAILDVPEHRRMPLYKNLLEKVDVNQNLYVFLLLMFEAHVIHANSEKQKAKETTRGELIVPKRLDIAADIARLFTTEIVICSCTKLLQYLQNLPEEKEDLPEKLLIDINHYSPKQFRHYKYITVTFISSLLSSKEFVHKVANLSDGALLNLEPIYKNMIINILTYIQNVAKTVDKNIDTPQSQYWKIMLHHNYDVLDSINALLTPQMFLLVVRGLSTHNLSTVRRRALELMNAKLQHDSNFFKNAPENELHAIIPCLINIVKQTEENLPSENEVIIQTSLLSLKLLVKLLAPENPEKFIPVLDFISILIKSGNAKGNILASTVLCLAELCNQLRAHSISNLPKFMPALIKLLKSHKHQDEPDLLLLSTTTALQKIIESVPLFLSSYLEKLLFELSLISAKWNKSEKIQPFVTKLINIKIKIGTTIPARVLIPIIETTYKKLISKNSYKGISPLMEVLNQKLSNIDNIEIQSNLNDLTSFFMNALQFRSEQLTQLEETNEIETYIIKTFVTLILKLSETSFRPLYYKIYDWAIRSDTKTERIITFYSLSSEVASCLKGLFVLFAGHFLNNAATILDSCNLLKQTEIYFEDEQKSLLLLDYVLKTLYVIFLHDSRRFINKERFDVLMQPIVDQLENNLGGENRLVDRVKDLVIPTIVQFAVATGDDALWKQLNYQVLLKMRHTSAKIRLGSLKCVLELSRKLGEEFLPLLPETIPFLAELLEDEEEEVEKTCQKTVQEMEKILGEPLQKYF
ncbi:HEAT repeat-containing protein 1 [Onthophagus taurus]|uniref:HEAT repeat-containing protein 1 n=1 Tax=Onthophagus taurus TaxID=166361 RepID=UPI0039BDE52E